MSTLRFYRKAQEGAWRWARMGRLATLPESRKHGGYGERGLRLRFRATAFPNPHSSPRVVIRGVPFLRVSVIQSGVTNDLPSRVSQGCRPTPVSTMRVGMIGLS